MGLGSKQKVVNCAIPDSKQSDFIIVTPQVVVGFDEKVKHNEIILATPQVIVSFDEKVKHNEIILATPQVVVGFDEKVSQEHPCRWNNPALFRRRSPEVVKVVNIKSWENPSYSNHECHFAEGGLWTDIHDLPNDIGKKKTGSWMPDLLGVEDGIALPHCVHSIRNSIINKRYADANELHLNFRFTTESQRNFKKHKLTPSGKKF